MKKITLHVYTSALVLAVAAVAVLALGLQHVQAAFTKAVAQGESIRVTEKNSCAESTQSEDTPHFSGCNSII